MFTFKCLIHGGSGDCGGGGDDGGDDGEPYNPLTTSQIFNFSSTMHMWRVSGKRTSVQQPQLNITDLTCGYQTVICLLEKKEVFIFYRWRFLFIENEQKSCDLINLSLILNDDKSV